MGGAKETKEKPKREKRLKNQFNYSERASQTLNNPLRVCTTTNQFVECGKQNNMFIRSPLLMMCRPCLRSI